MCMIYGNLSSWSVLTKTFVLSPFYLFTARVDRSSGYAVIIFQVKLTLIQPMIDARGRTVERKKFARKSSHAEIKRINVLSTEYYTSPCDTSTCSNHSCRSYDVFISARVYHVHPENNHVK